MYFSPVARRTACNPSFPGTDRSFERLFRDAALASPLAQTYAGRRPYQFEQDDTSFTLSIDVPGLGKEHLNIGIEGAVVRIESLADAPRQFKVAYELPLDIDATTSSATMAHGVLTLKLGKKLPVSQVSSLTIN